MATTREAGLNRIHRDEIEEGINECLYQPSEEPVVAGQYPVDFNVRQDGTDFSIAHIKR